MIELFWSLKNLGTNMKFKDYVKFEKFRDLCEVRVNPSIWDHPHLFQLHYTNILYIQIHTT